MDGTQQSSNAAPKAFLPIQKVEERVGFKKSHIYAKIKAGDFPAPLVIGGKNLWISWDIDGWIDARIAMAKAA